MWVGRVCGRAAGDRGQARSLRRLRREIGASGVGGWPFKMDTRVMEYTECEAMTNCDSLLCLENNRYDSTTLSGSTMF